MEALLEKGAELLHVTPRYFYSRQRRAVTRRRRRRVPLLPHENNAVIKFLPRYPRLYTR